MDDVGEAAAPSKTGAALTEVRSKSVCFDVFGPAGLTSSRACQGASRLMVCAFHWQFRLWVAEGTS